MEAAVLRAELPLLQRLRYFSGKRVTICCSCAETDAHTKHVQGLPEAWKVSQEPGTDWAAGSFSLNGELPEVEDNVSSASDLLSQPQCVA